MRRGSHLDSIVRQNRLNAVSKTVIKGGQAGVELAKAAKLPTDVYAGMMEFEGEMRIKFVPGLHPIDQEGLYVIP